MNNNSAIGDLNSSSQRPNSATLDRAFRIIGRANVSPQSIGRKLRRSGVTLAIGLISSIVLLLTIRLDLFQSATAGAMSVFLLLASLAVVIMSGIGMSFTVWSAFVHQHVQLLEAKAEVEEVTTQLQVVLNSMEQAVPQHAAEAQSTAQRLDETVLEAQTVAQEMHVELVDVQLVAAAAKVSRVAPDEINELVEAMKRTITEEVQLQERAVSNTG